MIVKTLKLTLIGLVFVSSLASREAAARCGDRITVLNAIVVLDDGEKKAKSRCLPSYIQKENLPGYREVPGGFVFLDGDKYRFINVSETKNLKLKLPKTTH